MAMLDRLTHSRLAAIAAVATGAAALGLAVPLPVSAARGGNTWAPAGTSGSARVLGAPPSEPEMSTNRSFLLKRGRYRDVTVPGATETEAGRINDLGQIAGGYKDANRRDHGFVRDQRGRVRTIDVPGATGTSAAQINNHGQLVGYYTDTGSLDDPANLRRGFLLEGGRFRDLDVPRAVQTQAYGINNRGQVVGDYLAADGTTHGFIWERGRFRTVDVPDGLATSPLGINDRGDNVGLYFDAAGAAHGFLLHNGVTENIDAPDAALTVPLGINNHAHIVGTTYRDPTLADSESHGFLLRRGSNRPFTPIDSPGAVSTIANGINNNGDITGVYRPAPSRPDNRTAQTDSQTDITMPNIGSRPNQLTRAT